MLTTDADPTDRPIMTEEAAPGWPARARGAWRRADLEADTGWVHAFEREWVDDLDTAVRGLRTRGATLDTVTRADVPLPRLGRFLDETLRADVAGRGLSLIRGLPRERYSDDELAMLFWGMGLHLGTGVSQNADGDRLGHVRSRGLDYDARDVRGYQTDHALEFHCDPSDVVGLLCLHQAPAGGESSVVSGLAVYETVAAERPEYLARLAEGFVYDRRGEEAFYQAPVSDPVPVFARAGDAISVRYVRKSIETGMAKLGRTFTAQELEILDYLDAVTRRPELVVSMRLEPGDMQFASNYTVLHARAAYVDHPEPERRRHLLRLWLKIDGFRALDARFVEHDAESGWSRREGIRPPDAPRPRDETRPLLG